MAETSVAKHGLPHGEPFIFVDRVLETRDGEWAICEVTFRPERDFFRGPFSRPTHRAGE